MSELAWSSCPTPSGNSFFGKLRVDTEDAHEEKWRWICGREMVRVVVGVGVNEVESESIVVGLISGH